MHRQCASLTAEAFTKPGESNEPFYCLHCTGASHKQEINILKEQDKSLITKIDSLLTAHSSVPTENIDTPNTKKVQSPSLHDKNPSKILSSDRKFNLVILGIDESPTGTNRSERVKYDVESSVSILSKLNSDINSTSISQT